MFLVKFAIPITSCGTTCPIEITRSHPSNSWASTATGIASAYRPAVTHAHLLTADLAEDLESVPPVVDEQLAGTDLVAEHRRHVSVGHRDVRAQRRQHPHRAAECLEFALSASQ